jgi:hypothetical protein
MSEIGSSELVVNQPWLSHVIRRVQSLRFGSIHIKVHDGQVVVVESLEQKRFQPPVKDSESKPARGPRNAAVQQT